MERLDEEQVAFQKNEYFLLSCLLIGVFFLWLNKVLLMERIYGNMLGISIGINKDGFIKGLVRVKYLFLCI